MKATDQAVHTLNYSNISYPEQCMGRAWTTYSLNRIYFEIQRYLVETQRKSHFAIGPICVFEKVKTITILKLVEIKELIYYLHVDE